MKPLDPGQIIEARAVRYGDFVTNAGLAQALKAVIIAHPKTCLLAPHKREALDLICTKIARIVNGDPDYPDSWDDIGGFAELGKIRGVPNPVPIDYGDDAWEKLAEMPQGEE